MHQSSSCFWCTCTKEYPIYLDNPKARRLEVGSRNVNGSLRDLLGRCKEHTGVDFRPGPCVDVVSLAHEMNFNEKFDAVISASMLEHDPYWKLSIPNMLRYLKQDGIFILNWGSSRNHKHGTEYSANGIEGHYSLPAGKVLRLLESMNIYVHKFHYEGNFVKHQWGYPLMPARTLGGGMGEVVLIAFKDKKYSTGNAEIDELLPCDDA